MAATPSTSSSTNPASDGPVLRLINKRLRALRKKLKRIYRMEVSLSEGKSLNKEQLEVLRSKSSVIAGIEELEKLRHPLSEAVEKEITLSLEKFKRRAATLGKEREERNEENARLAAVADLLRLLYFGRIFDVKSLMREHENFLMRVHERNCCLTYDHVTDNDDVGSILKECDLDMLATVGSSMISRQEDSRLSHRHALQKCIEHAKLWLQNSEQPIHPGLGVTYAVLREKLNRITDSEYFAVTPEMRFPLEVAGVLGNHNIFQIPLQESLSSEVILTDQGAEYDQEEGESSNSDANEVYDNETGCVEGHCQIEGSDVDNISELLEKSEQGIPDTEVDQNSNDTDSKEQEHATQMPYQKYRGDRGGGGGSCKGYANSHTQRKADREACQNNYRGLRGMARNIIYNTPAIHV